MHGTYKIHDFVIPNILDAVLEDGIVYGFDGGDKVALCDMPFWEQAYNYNLCVISCGELFGYADIRTGRIVHQPRWEDAIPFNKGRARVRENGKFGFINLTGEYVIEPQWDDAERSWLSGLLGVCKDKKWGFINEANRLVTPLEWEAFATSLSGSITTSCDSNLDFRHENLPRAVCKDGKWGFINNGGHIIIDPQFDSLDFIWLGFQVHWLEDKAAAVPIKSDKEIAVFGRSFPPPDMTVCPMYLPVKRGSHWYHVQMDVDGSISVLKNKHPNKKEKLQ